MSAELRIGVTNQRGQLIREWQYPIQRVEDIEDWLVFAQRVLPHKILRYDIKLTDPPPIPRSPDAHGCPAS